MLRLARMLLGSSRGLPAMAVRVTGCVALVDAVEGVELAVAERSDTGTSVLASWLAHPAATSTTARQQILRMAVFSLVWAQLSRPFEVLNFPLVFLRRGKRNEGFEVFPLARFRI